MSKTPLRKLREYYGLSQQQVARAAGIAQSVYSDMEAAKGGLTRENAEKVVRVIGPPLTEEAVLWPHRFTRFLEPSL